MEARTRCLAAGLAALLSLAAGCGDVAVEAGDVAPEAGDVAPEATDIAREAVDAPVDAFDLPADALDVPPDPGSAPAWWEGLAGSGEPVGRIAGVASHMSNGEAADPLRDFEFDEYLAIGEFRIRRGLRWNHVEPAQDEWHFEKVRTPVQMAAEHNVRILPLLAYGVDWAQSDPDKYGSLNVPDYADYAGHMAAEFCATVKDYELWNEENLTRFWHLPPDPAKYADLLIASAAAIRAACPDARVVFGGIASWDDVDMFNVWGFLRLALAARPEACDAFDVLGLHPYTWFQFDPPERDTFVSYDVTLPGQTGMTTLARDILAQAGCAPKPILFTEVGWPSYDLTEEQVGRYAARSLLLAARDGVEGWYWYTFWDDDPDASAIRPHENFFGLWAWPGADETVRRPKPAWFAVKAAATVLQGFRFARDLGPALGLPNDVYALAFTKADGGIRLALWDGRDVPDVTEDGDGPGGPDTTHELDLPLPACTTALRAWAQDGAVLDPPPPGATVRRVLTPAVQYLEIRCDPL